MRIPSMQIGKAASKLTAVMFITLMFFAVPSAADDILGIDTDGVIWIVDTDECSATELVDTGDDGGGVLGPNSLGYDQVNQRVYYADLPDPCTNSDLSFYDVQADSITFAGTLTGCPSDADYHNGAYYYVNSGTDDLYEVLFNMNGTINSVTKISDLTGGAELLSFGDVATRNDGILFGSASRSSDSAQTVFTADLGNLPSFSFINTNSNSYQLAFGNDGQTTLFGHSVSANNLVTIDQNNGNDTEICSSISGGSTGFNDLSDFEPIIDVKPGSDPSCFNINGHGKVPVAIFGAPELDVTTIDAESLEFGGMPVATKNGEAQCSVEDIDNDGFDDLVCQFEDDGDFDHNNGTACVEGDFENDGGFTFCGEICLRGGGAGPSIGPARARGRR